MLTLYAYTYPAARVAFPGFILTKVGDTHRDVWTRLNEQGGAAEWQNKDLIGHNTPHEGVWTNLVNIKRDYQVHRILEEQGLKHTEGNGTEWFKIPASNDREVYEHIDAIVKKLEDRAVRKPVKLRKLQKKKMKEVVDIIENAIRNGKDVATIIANLCPRFGKTIWAMRLFNEITKRWGNKTMILPAYWLSSQTSFKNEIHQYSDFQDIEVIEANHPNAFNDYNNIINSGNRAVIVFSLHGDYEAWIGKYGWMRNIPLEDIFSFLDEGDFGAHTPEQKKKIAYLFDRA